MDEGSSASLLSLARTQATRLSTDSIPGRLVVSQLFGWEGAIAPVTSGFEGFFVSSQFPTFRPKANLDTGFARWLVRNPKVWEQLKAAAKGMGDRRRTLSPDIFLNVTSLLPPLAEQQRIVAHLDAIEARITRVQKLREEAAAEVAALFLKLLGEAVTPHGEGWKRETVTDVIESMDAGWSPQCDDIPAREGEWGVLKTTSVQWGNFQPKYNKALPSDLVAVPSLAVKKGDVLVTRAGPRKRVAVVAAVRRNEPKLTKSDKIIRLRANRARIHPRFLELSLASPFSQEHLVQRKTGLADAQVNISQSILRATPVAYPALNDRNELLLSWKHLAVRLMNWRRGRRQLVPKLQPSFPRCSTASSTLERA